MANKKKSMPAWLVLTIITIVAALGLSLTHLATKDIIAKRAADEKNQALIALVPDADTFDDMEIPEGLALDSFDAAKKDGALLAYLAQTTVQGYGGPIEVITAMDTEYKLLGISVGGSDFAETAGLGSKVQEPDFVDQYKGIVAPVKMNSDVDQVSGATISSNAVNKGVNSAVENVKIALGDTSGIVTEEEKRANVLAALLPEATAFEAQELPEGSELDSFEIAKAGDEIIAYVAQVTVKGFAGPIEVITATDLDYSLIGIAVGGSDFAETEGLGSKVMDPEFTDAFKGLAVKAELNKNIDQVSGATISSQAVVDAVNKAVNGLKLVNGVEIEEAEETTVVEEEPVVEEVKVELVPGADTYEEQVLANDSLDKLEIAKTGDEILAYVGQLTGKGFAGPIEVKIATDKEFNIIGIEVGGEAFAETPGLGSKVTESEFKDQYIGLSNPIELNKDIDQVSGATISSVVVNDTVNAILENIKAYFSVDFEAEPTEAPAEDVEEEPTVEEEKPIEEPAVKEAPSVEEAKKVLGLVEGADLYEEQVLADDALDKLEVAKDGDEIIGYVGQLSVKGFAGPIEVKVATDKEFNIIGIEVGGEGFAETPGLGSKVTEAEFKDQFIGLSNPVELNKDVDQVSGATISSVAVNDTVNAILENIKAYFSVELEAEAEPTATPTEEPVVEEEPTEEPVVEEKAAEEKPMIEEEPADTEEPAVEERPIEENNEEEKPAEEPVVEEKSEEEKNIADEIVADEETEEVSFVEGADIYEEQVLTDNPLKKLEIAKAGDEIIAYVGQLAVQGFAGPIEIKVATDIEFKILGIEVGGEDFAETPGIGSKVLDAEFTDQYIGLSYIIELNKDVDQVSGATVSSTAVNDAVNVILENIKVYFEAE